MPGNSYTLKASIYEPDHRPHPTPAPRRRTRKQGAAKNDSWVMHAWHETGFAADEEEMMLMSAVRPLFAAMMQGRKRRNTGISFIKRPPV